MKGSSGSRKGKGEYRNGAIIGRVGTSEDNPGVLMAINEAPLFTPVLRVRAHEAIVQQVEEAVRGGALRPGDHLASERELMAQFGVSRSTVREALRVLESNGLVRSRPGAQRGPEILAYSTEQLSQSIHSLVQIERLTLFDLVFFRMLVEGTLSGLAASLRTSSDLATLADCMQRMKTASSDAFSHADVAFHEAVAEIGGNRLLIVCNAVVRTSVSNLIAEKIASGEHREEQMDEAVIRHTALYEAIGRGDAQDATRVSRTNIYEYYAIHVNDDEARKLKLLLT